MTQNEHAKTSRTINVNEQPPAAHFTTKYTAKHNALFATGWGAIDARADQKILPDEGGVEIF